MKLEKLPALTDALVQKFADSMPMKPLSAGGYAQMRYPKFPALMRFFVKRYACEGFGNVFTMDTRAMGGLMQLATLTFTPNCGGDVPLLLIDVMVMGKKRAAFVEYYDLTAAGARCPALDAVKARFDALPEYPEKPAWYLAERAPYSLIKGGDDDAALSDMLIGSVGAYAETCAAQSGRSAENLAGLEKMVERMVREGNPSSGTMERVLAKAGAEEFFRTAIMPARYTEESLKE